MSTKKGVVRSKSYMINAIIGLVLMFGIGFLPPVEPITEMGMKVLGIFVGLIYLYSACEVSWPSLVAIIGLVVVGYCNLSAATGGSLGHSVVFQSATAYIVAGSLEYYGVTEFIARWALSRKALQGKPRLFTFTCYLTIFCIAIFTGSLALIILMWAIFESICKLLGYTKEDTYYSSSLVGIVVAFCLGSQIAPIRSWQLSLSNLWGSTVAPLNLGKYMLFSIPVSLIGTALYLFYQEKILKADFSKIKDFDVSTIQNAATMDKRQKKLLAIAGITFAFVFLAALLPKSFPLYDLISNKIAAAGFFALGAAYMIVTTVDGKESLINFVEVSGHCIQWNCLLMIGATMLVASAVTNESTGIMAFISQALAVVFEGKGPTFLLLFTAVFTWILTNCASNIAIGSMMIPIVAPFLETTGANAQVIGTVLIYLTNVALILPGSSAPAGLIFSHPCIKRKDAYKYNFIGMGLAFCVVLVAGSILNLIGS